MSWEIPPHLSHEDFAELGRLLALLSKDDTAAAEKWLETDLWDLRAKPIDLIKSGELGVVRVISYLKDAAP